MYCIYMLPAHIDTRCPCRTTQETEALTRRKTERQKMMEKTTKTNQFQNILYYRIMTGVTMYIQDTLT